MEIVFDPAKDVANLAKHGLSLAEASAFDFTCALITIDDRFDYGETRFRALADMGGQGRCLVFTIVGPETIRVISYRRTRRKEMKRYGI